MFSKYDVYTTVQSIYCYPDTDVLINRELERVFRNIHQQNLPNKKRQGQSDSKPFSNHGRVEHHSSVP